MSATEEPYDEVPYEVVDGSDSEIEMAFQPRGAARIEPTRAPFVLQAKKLPDVRWV